MKFIFKHETYHFIVIDSNELKQLKESYYPPFLKDKSEFFDFNRLTNFSHSNCMWTDDFREYDYPMYVDQPKKVIEHEFNKLKSKFGVSFNDVILNNEYCVIVPINFDDWMKDNLLYNVKVR